MEIIREKDILGKLLLPLNSEWEVSEIETNKASEEILVRLRYKYDYVEENGVRYSIYDRRKERRWRHLDLWQYKTYLLAQLPRYKDKSGHFRSVFVPWADACERMSILLEKKR
jgi:transposase